MFAVFSKDLVAEYRGVRVIALCIITGCIYLGDYYGLAISPAKNVTVRSTILFPSKQYITDTVLLLSPDFRSCEDRNVTWRSAHTPLTED
jgi:hypothetical protein